MKSLGVNITLASHLNQYINSIKNPGANAAASNLSRVADPADRGSNIYWMRLTIKNNLQQADLDQQRAVLLRRVRGRPPLP